MEFLWQEYWSGKNTGVLCHSLLQWTTFCRNSPLRPTVIHYDPTQSWVALHWWLTASLSYTNAFIVTSLGSQIRYKCKSTELICTITEITQFIFNSLHVCVLGSYQVLHECDSTVFILLFDSCTYTFNLLQSEEGLTCDGTKSCPSFPSMSFSV